MPMDVRNEYFIRFSVRGDCLRRALCHVGRKERGMLRAGSIDDDIGGGKSLSGLRIQAGSDAGFEEELRPTTSRFRLGIFNPAAVRMRIDQVQLLDLRIVLGSHDTGL